MTANMITARLQKDNCWAVHQKRSPLDNSGQSRNPRPVDRRSMHSTDLERSPLSNRKHNDSLQKTITGQYTKNDCRWTTVNKAGTRDWSIAGQCTYLVDLEQSPLRTKANIAAISKVFITKNQNSISYLPTSLLPCLCSFFYGKTLDNLLQHFGYSWISDQ